MFFCNLKCVIYSFFQGSPLFSLLCAACPAGRECGEQPKVGGAVPVGTEAGAVQPPGAALLLPARHLRLAGLLLHPVRGLRRLGPGLPDHGGHRLIGSLVNGNHRGQHCNTAALQHCSTAGFSAAAQASGVRPLTLFPFCCNICRFAFCSLP